MSSGATSLSFPDLDWDIRRAPYIDVCFDPLDPPDPKDTTPNPVRYMTKSKVDGFTLAFGVVKKNDPADTTLRWGGHTQMYDGQKKNPDGTYGRNVDADLAHGEWEKGHLQEFTKNGGKFAISFGGQADPPLEKHWDHIDKDLKKAAYAIASQHEEIISNYSCEHLDFDFEAVFFAGNGDALNVHVAAMSQLLQKCPNLRIGYTLPVSATPTREGFTQDGKDLFGKLAAAKIQPSLITGMLMGYDSDAPADWWTATRNALEGSGKPDSEGMHKQIKTAFGWDDKKAWRRMGACPQFGAEHAEDPRKCTPDDIVKLVEYARVKNIGCISGWCVNRDAGGKYYTYVNQQPYDFCKKIATYQPKDM